MMEANEFKKIPNRKKWLLTDQFLQDFKLELDTVWSDIEEEDRTFHEFYGQVLSTGGFYQALEKACKKHNVVKAIYEYAQTMRWFDSDIFDYELVNLMLQRGIIKYHNPKSLVDYENHLKQLEKDGELVWVDEVEKYDGYSVTKRDWKYV